MIAVCIATYNHEAFIAQAIDSVLAQVCDEPIRIYIGDDASTDGTGAICERYAAKNERIVYVHRATNIGLTANTIDLYRRILADGCEYIAMLDGDDYWTDSNKLQLQVDYLRSHSEVGLVHTAVEGQSAETIPTGDSAFSMVRLPLIRSLLPTYQMGLSAPTDGRLAGSHLCFATQRGTGCLAVAGGAGTHVEMVR